MEKNRSSRETIATHHIQDGVQHHRQTDPGGPGVVLDGSGHRVELIVSGQFQVVQNRLVAAVAQQRESVCSREKKPNIRSEPSRTRLAERDFSLFTLHYLQRSKVTL